MSVMIGSARIDENGKATGGKAGDQKQTSAPDYRGEVSQQEFYMHSKGWYVIRPKSANHAELIASKMIVACNNANIGYDQNQRLGVISKGVSSKTATECDCSSLVRECVKEATGRDPGDFYTGNEVGALVDTGLFEKPIVYAPGTFLYTGDILVTKTKGHTAIVTSGRSRAESNKTDNTSKPKQEKANADVAAFQKAANADGYCDSEGDRLEVDGILGKCTKQVMNQILLRAKKRAGVYTIGSMGKLVEWWQNICKKNVSPKLAADGQFGKETRSATIQMQRKLKVDADGEVGCKTLTALFGG